jgi:hypothetical protein
MRTTEHAIAMAKVRFGAKDSEEAVRMLMAILENGDNSVTPNGPCRKLWDKGVGYTQDVDGNLVVITCYCLCLSKDKRSLRLRTGGLKPGRCAAIRRGRHMPPGKWKRGCTFRTRIFPVPRFS